MAVPSHEGSYSSPKRTFGTLVRPGSEITADYCYQSGAVNHKFVGAAGILNTPSLYMSLAWVKPLSSGE